MTFSSLRVLVAEDDDFQRGFVAKLLLAQGVDDVLLAADGHAALRLLDTEAIHVVVCDLDMPGMDGLEFLRHVAQAQRGCSVIVLSAASSGMLQSVEAMATAYGVRLLGVVRKPLRAAVLSQLLARHTEAAPAGPPAAPADLDAHRLREALANDEFVACFQPKVCMRTLRVTGVEALARWRPDGELLAPEVFLRAVEQAQLSQALGWAMLRQGCAFSGALQQVAPGATVSVNLSVDALIEPDTAQRIAALVQECGVQPWQVVLEITESAAAHDRLGPVLENLARLRMRGFGLSIDDYGTGYSSLQQLSRVPFSELKIDQSFVRSAASSDSALIVLESTLELAARMKLATVAEGIETRAQWDLLRGMGCDGGQGNLLTRPLLADDLLRWIGQWNAGVAAGRPLLAAP